MHYLESQSITTQVGFMRQNLVIEKIEQLNNSYQSHQLNQFKELICDTSVVM